MNCFINTNFAAMDLNFPFTIGSFHSTIPEMVAVAFGLLSVWYMKKERSLAGPLGIINVLIYVYIFFITRLYANAAINGYFFVMSVYGWYNWTRKDQEKPRVRIATCSGLEWFINIVAITVLFFVIRYLLIRYTESNVPDWDALTTAVYMVAQWLLSQKKIENWILWIVADTVMVVLCFYEGLYFTAFQYLVFTVIATLGFLEWRIKLRK